MGTIKTTNIETITGSGTLTLGQSGETISVPSGATLTVPSGGLSGQNYPAFYAHLSASQSVTNNTLTKAQIDSELFDTDGCYDNATNYRFTPTVAGHYFVTGCISGESGTNDSLACTSAIFKNGSYYTNHNFSSSAIFRRFPCMTTAVVYMNGSTDYIELFGSISSTGASVEFNAGSNQTFFTAYRIGD
jgi:hypothetical protein